MIDDKDGRLRAAEIAECPLVPVSWGELLDKITILELKRDRLSDEAALAHVAYELELLTPLAAPVILDRAINSLLGDLRKVNATLWIIEDEIRQEERAGEFGSRFIEIARSVYRRNDERGSIKREINLRLGSVLVEEKSFETARLVHVAD